MKKKPEKPAVREFYRVGTNNGCIGGLKDGDIVELEYGKGASCIFSVNGKSNHFACDGQTWGLDYPDYWGWQRISSVESELNNTYEIY